MATKKGFAPTIVHAYRRLPHFDANGKELPVVVNFGAEKVLFASNDAGHIVATVQNEDTFNRLTKEIPEAYIVYAGGENVPEKRLEPAPTKPEGKFVLTNGTDKMVLDDLDDIALREFAAGAGLEEEQLPGVLTGDTLKQAIYNLLTSGS